MKFLSNLIKNNEEWLMEQILAYAKRQDYTRYTSTLKEAWRVSIEGLSNAVCEAIESGINVELTPDESYTDDPVAEFGVIEAQRHRDRGINYQMFMGLFKYYVQSYMDLIYREDLPRDMSEKYISYISRVFDRIEIAFSTEWINLRENDKLDALRDSNRKMTNEKNMFLTIVESLANPVILLNSYKKVVYINRSASELLQLSSSPGGFYYNRDTIQMNIPQWLKDQTDIFFTQGKKESDFETIHINSRTYQGRISMMEDISGKFSGAVLLLNDITDIKLASNRIKELLTEKEIILKEVHHRIKNNMNNIKLLLLLQTDTLNDPSAISALQDAQSRIDSMMVLYDKLYRSENFKTMSVREYLSALIDEIAENFTIGNTVKIEKRIDDFVLDIKRLQHLGVIVNELMTNMLKYAFTGINNGEISVSVLLDDKTVKLTIGDNGIGMPESVNFRNSTGFGMQLVSILTEQICGRINIEHGNGTRFILEFDL